MIKNFMFTSESVTEGHPDKVCDQICDAVVDHFLMQDPHGRVRVECAVSSAVVFIDARFSSTETIDFSHIARKVIKRIGYDQPDFNAKTCSILTALQDLPFDASRQFNERELSEEEMGRVAPKTQVTLFGFACDQSPALMPLPIWLARKLSQQLSAVRRNGVLPYLMPDGKVQVGIVYRDEKPHKVHSITVTASQRDLHAPGAKEMEQDILEAVVEPVFGEEPIKPDRQTRIFVNPDGPFLGGPAHHSGLTGRKNAVDTYGEYSRHSGNALSGKDPSRIDRVGAYMARYAAKNLVAAGLAKECEVVLSYSIGLVEPVSLQVRTSGAGAMPDDQLTDLVREAFDFRLAAILKQFDLRRLPEKHNSQGFYERLAAFGHMGRTDMDLPWEKTDKSEALLKG